MAVQIRLARTLEDREAVFRLRYEVYTQELKRNQHHVDHERRRIEEPLDQEGNLFVAYHGDQAVGTVRSNAVRAGHLADYVELYEMEQAFAGCAAMSSVTTKMIVASAHRSNALGYRLALAGYEQLLSDGIDHDFIDVYPARLPFVQRLGYHVHKYAVHPEYGEVIVMRLDMRDIQHLESVKSPFCESLRRIQKVA